MPVFSRALPSRIVRRGIDRRASSASGASASRLLLSAAMLLTPFLLPAQVVRGRVTAEQTGAALAGVVVTLLDSAGGVTSRRALTGDDGTFAVRAPAPGTYVVEARAVGFVRVRKRAPTLGNAETGVVDIAMTRVATRLTAVRVPARSGCGSTAQMEGFPAEVWNDVWTALAAADVTQEQRLVRSDVLRYSRELDSRTGVIRAEERAVLTGASDRPFLAARPADLARHGFRQEADDGRSITFYAPDAQTLLSPEFLATHCFGLVRSDSNSEHRIGLQFRPQNPRAPNEIEGTLWTDAASRELRVLEFTYLGVSDGSRRRFGGSVFFGRLPQGPWIVARWRLEAPILRRVVRGEQRFGSLRLQREAHDTLIAVHESGGLALNDSSRLQRLRTMEGSVTIDSGGRRVPLPRAQVELLGTDRRTESDSGGRFHLSDLLPGKYELRAHRSASGHAAGFVDRKTIDVTAGHLNPVELVAPSDSATAATLCRGWTPRANSAPMLAVVRDTKSGRPIANHTFELEWSRFAVTGGPLTIQQRVEKRNLTTDWRGELVFCALPEHATVRFRSTQTAAREWTSPLRAGVRLLVVDLSLDPASGALAWLTADSSSATMVAREGASAAGRGQIIGRVVREDSPAITISDAEISIDGTELTTRSDSAGAFRFDSVPNGWYAVSARRPGFAPFTAAVLFRSGESTQLRIRLAAIRTALPEVRVEETRPASIGMRGFDERRRAKIGKFIGPEELEKHSGPTLSGLIANRIPGFELVPLVTRGYMSGGFGVASKHFRAMSLSGRTQDQLCFAKIVVDGQRVSRGVTGDPVDIDQLKPGEVAGMEFYRGASEVPTEFSGPDAACGVVVVWTKKSR